MPIATDQIIRRLTAGLLVLAALLAFVPGASAHGRAHEASASLVEFEMSVDVLVSVGQPASDRTCPDGWSCCLLGQCSMTTILGLAGSTTGIRLQQTGAIYVGTAATVPPGLYAGPTTPPPRVNA